MCAPDFEYIYHVNHLNRRTKPVVEGADFWKMPKEKQLDSDIETQNQEEPPITDELQ